MFIHGVRSSSALWDAQIRAAHAAGYEAVAVDLPGHGARRDERFTLDNAFTVIDDAIASVGEGTSPVVLVGLSLGGYVTLEYAARRPARLAGVIASACTCDPKGKPVRMYGQVAHHVTRAISSVQAWAGRWTPALVPDLAGRRLRVDGSTAPFRPGWDVVTDMLGQLAGRSSIENLKQITVPIWFVNGQRDHLRLEEKKYLAAVPTSRLVVIPKAGHDVSFEAPHEFNRVMLTVLEDIEHERATQPATARTPAPVDVPAASGVAVAHGV
ncbi:Pimeloyl-ACP methyl ester carboxylesterase [Sanguibacter gelidistatuariae]|uniref:Pimeloyl-ACP methyl ester carboxylesterase n=1 Tax=Sanguibacter gelidistatuariae TaxID=1814289 RepID=A0A1G6L0I3_9MICO|nr:Pimeloyl-ACP methyl ester carboxylesterase [Sanguibacter gelidistatuariae]